MARPSEVGPHASERHAAGIPGEGEGAEEAPVWDRTASFLSRSAPGPDPLLPQPGNRGYTCQMVDRHAVARMLKRNNSQSVTRVTECVTAGSIPARKPANNSGTLK